MTERWTTIIDRRLQNGNGFLVQTHAMGGYASWRVLAVCWSAVSDPLPHHVVVLASGNASTAAAAEQAARTAFARICPDTTTLRAAVRDYNCLLASDAAEADQPDLFHDAAGKVVIAALAVWPDILNEKEV